MVKPGDNQTSKMLADISRKTGGDFSNVRRIPIMETINWGDERATLNAFPGTRVTLFVADPDSAIDERLEKSMEGAANKVSWVNATEANISRLFASHPDFVKQSIAKWQDVYGLVVDKEGKIGKAE